MAIKVFVVNLSAMVIVPSQNSRRTSPVVNFRKAAANGQRTLAMNASLVRQVQLDKYTHLAVDLDEKKRTITFIPVKGELYQGHQAHRLQRDGGGNAVGKAIYISESAIGEKMLASGRYTATLGNAGKFTIYY